MNEIAWWFAQNAVTTTLLLPAIWLAARLRPFHPAEQHLLWLLLLVKLITPPVILWPFAIQDLPLLASTRSASEGPFLVARRVSEGPFDNPLPLSETPVETAAASHFIELKPSSAPSLSPLPHITIEPSSLVESPAPAPTPPLVPDSSSWLHLTALLWLAGATIVTARTLRQAALQWSILRTASNPPAQLKSLVDDLAARMRLARVPVKVSSRATSPFIACLGRPILVWPAALTGANALASCEGVIAHELAHVRRRDHWVARLEALAAPLWWWHPVFWIARRRLDETRELACDALALALHDADRRAFAENLLAFSAGGTPPLAHFQTGIAPRHPLRRRLTMLFDPRTTGRISTPGLLLCATLATAALPAWAWSQENPPETTPTAPATALATRPAAENPPVQPVSDPPALAPANVLTAESAPLQPVQPSPVAPPAAGAPPTAAAPLPSVSPPPATNDANLPATASRSRTMHEIVIGEGRIVRIEAMPDGNGVVLSIFENGRLIRAQALTGLSIAAGDSTAEPQEPAGLPTQPAAADSNAFPAGQPPVAGTGPAALPRGPAAGFGTGSITLPGPPHLPSASRLGGLGAASRPTRANTQRHLKLLENALQLAELEVQQQQILLEQAREKHGLDERLHEKGFAPKPASHELKLLEIELRKAQLHADQARIELEAATEENERLPTERRSPFPAK